MMLICNKQHLSNIRSLIHEKVKQHLTNIEVKYMIEKSATYKKCVQPLNYDFFMGHRPRDKATIKSQQ